MLIWWRSKSGVKLGNKVIRSSGFVVAKCQTVRVRRNGLCDYTDLIQ
jgi:hypothetical protein